MSWNYLPNRRSFCPSTFQETSLLKMPILLKPQQIGPCYSSWKPFKTMELIFSTFYVMAGLFKLPTLPPIIMVQWKMLPSNSSFLSLGVVFYIHDYGRKGSHRSLRFRSTCCKLLLLFEIEQQWHHLVEIVPILDFFDSIRKPAHSIILVSNFQTHISSSPFHNLGGFMWSAVFPIEKLVIF